jgi:hypothetical protein
MNQSHVGIYEPITLPSFNKFLMLIAEADAEARQQEEHERYQDELESPQEYRYESEYRESEPKVSRYLDSIPNAKEEGGFSERKYIGPLSDRRFNQPLFERRYDEPLSARRFNEPVSIFTDPSTPFNTPGWDSPALDRNSPVDFNSTKAKPRRKTKEQVAALKELYSLDRFPSRTDQFILSKQTALSLKDIQLWFQNQRRNQKQ